MNKVTLIYIIHEALTRYRAGVVPEAHAHFRNVTVDGDGNSAEVIVEAMDGTNYIISDRAVREEDGQ